MGVVEKIKEAMKGGGGDHKHTPIDDAWEQVVSVIGPKLAEGVWQAMPAGIKDIVSKPGAENVFNLLSFGFARILPDSGAGAFINTLQRETAGELRELAQKHRNESGAGESNLASTPVGADKAMGAGMEGAYQILRLELERANNIAAWLACVKSAPLADLKVHDVVKFLDGLTLRELRTFADMDDAAKQVYAEARIGKTLPKVESSSTAANISAWFSRRWSEVKDCLEKAQSDLTEIALVQDEEIRALEQDVSRLRAEANRPLGFKAWQLWKL